MMNAASEYVRRLVAWGRQADANAAARRAIGGVGIVGAGVMGVEIAAAHLRRGVPVVLCDIDAEVLGRAPAAIAAELAKRAQGFPFAEMTSSEEDEASEMAATRLRTTADLSEAARCDLVIEAIAERLSAKLQLFAQLSEHSAGSAVLASNTSTIPLERLADAVSDPSRLCGIHFCHPVRERPLVEIVRGRRTSDSTNDAAVAHVHRLNRLPIVVEDGPGFVVNRLLFPYLGEALELLRQGVPGEAIEEAALDFGMAKGPLRLMDEIGLDTTLQAGWVLATAFPERIVPSPILVSMVKAGRLGEKSDGGFFSYPADGSERLASAAREIIARWVEESPTPRPRADGFGLIAPMLFEATRILDEGKVEDARAIDLAALFGLGFPVAKGGLLWWADSIGVENILARLGDDERSCRPTPLIERLARSGGRLLDPR